MEKKCSGCQWFERHYSTGFFCLKADDYGNCKMMPKYGGEYEQVSANGSCSMWSDRNAKNRYGYSED